MKIEYLADHKYFIPTLARWSFDEWSYIHPERTLSDVEKLMQDRSNKEQTPLCLVAIDNGKVLGLIALKISDLESRPNLSPWLAVLYFHKNHRDNGVGTNHVRAIVKEAVKLRVNKLFLYTPEAEGFYSQLGWSVHERTEWQGHSVTVMEKILISD